MKVGGSKKHNLVRRDSSGNNNDEYHNDVNYGMKESELGSAYLIRENRGDEER